MHCVTKSVTWRYLGNQEWYHRSAGVKTTQKKTLAKFKKFKKIKQIKKKILNQNLAIDTFFVQIKISTESLIHRWSEWKRLIFFLHTLSTLFIVEVSTIEPTMMKEGWSKGHQSPYYWASSQCWNKFLLPAIDFVIIFPVLMCCPPKGRNYREVLFNLLYGWYGGTDVLFLLLVNKTKHLIAFFSHSFSLHPIHFSKTQ